MDKYIKSNKNNEIIEANVIEAEVIEKKSTEIIEIKDKHKPETRNEYKPETWAEKKLDSAYNKIFKKENKDNHEDPLTKNEYKPETWAEKKLDSAYNKIFKKENKDNHEDPLTKINKVYNKTLKKVNIMIPFQSDEIIDAIQKYIKNDKEVKITIHLINKETLKVTFKLEYKEMIDYKIKSYTFAKQEAGSEKQVINKIHKDLDKKIKNTKSKKQVNIKTMIKLEGLNLKAINTEDNKLSVRKKLEGLSYAFKMFLGKGSTFTIFNSSLDSFSQTFYDNIINKDKTTIMDPNFKKDNLYNELSKRAILSKNISFKSKNIESSIDQLGRKNNAIVDKKSKLVFEENKTNDIYIIFHHYQQKMNEERDNEFNILLERLKTIGINAKVYIDDVMLFYKKSMLDINKHLKNDDKISIKHTNDGKYAEIVKPILNKMSGHKIKYRQQVKILNAKGVYTQVRDEQPFYLGWLNVLLNMNPKVKISATFTTFLEYEVNKYITDSIFQSNIKLNNTAFNADVYKPLVEYRKKMDERELSTGNTYEESVLQEKKERYVRISNPNDAFCKVNSFKILLYSTIIPVDKKTKVEDQIHQWKLLDNMEHIIKEQCKNKITFFKNDTPINNKDWLDRTLNLNYKLKNYVAELTLGQILSGMPWSSLTYETYGDVIGYSYFNKSYSVVNFYAFSTGGSGILLENKPDLNVIKNHRIKQIKKDNITNNGNILILGKSGSGKTTFLNKIILDNKMNGKNTIIIDPQGDFSQKALKLGYNIYNFSNRIIKNPKTGELIQNTAINPFEIIGISSNVSLTDKKEYINNKIEWLKNWLQTLYPNFKLEKGKEDLMVLLERVKLIYNSDIHKILTGTLKWPTFESIKTNFTESWLESLNTDHEYFEGYLDSYRNHLHSNYEEYPYLYEFLFTYTKNDTKISKLFNTNNNTQLNKQKLIVFNVVGMTTKDQNESDNNIIKDAFYSVLFKFVSELITSGTYLQKCLDGTENNVMFVLDEAHMYLSKDTEYRKELLSYTKTIRKFGGLMVFSTQEIDDIISQSKDKTGKVVDKDETLLGQISTFFFGKFGGNLKKTLDKINPDYYEDLPLGIEFLYETYVGTPKDTTSKNIGNFLMLRDTLGGMVYDVFKPFVPYYGLEFTERDYNMNELWDISTHNTKTIDFISDIETIWRKEYFYDILIKFITGTSIAEINNKKINTCISNMSFSPLQIIEKLILNKAPKHLYEQWKEDLIKQINKSRSDWNIEEKILKKLQLYYSKHNDVINIFNSIEHWYSKIYTVDQTTKKWNMWRILTNVHN